MQDSNDLVHFAVIFDGHAGEDVIEGDSENTIFIQTVDNGEGNQLVDLGHALQIQLLFKMALQ